MNGAGRAEVRRARRWFWTLTVVAVLAMGTLSHGLRAAAGPGTGLLVGASALVLAASSIQAARIWLLLAGPPRLLAQRTPHQGRRSGQ
ncbi:hypothetical protein [Streptomyces sp. NPDC002676]